MSIGRDEIVKRATDDSGLTVAECSAVANSIFGQITKALIRGDEVTIRGLGTFKVVPVKEKAGFNFHTKEKVVKPAHMRPKIKFSKDLLAKIAQLTPSGGTSTTTPQID